MSRWFQIESLYKFNAKFGPEWVPRFMVFTSTKDAIRVGLAALEAEAFLVWPKVEARRIRQVLGNAVRQARQGPEQQRAAQD
jgi:lysyl-tRNA synthetase class 2